jgi:hypothetical protein
MLKHATPAQNETFERLRVLFSAKGIKFTLVGAAACREHGLPRPTDDLDIVVCHQPSAVALLCSSGEFLTPKSDDQTNSPCTLQDVKTGVRVDFLTGDTRINDHTLFPGGEIHDPLPIPRPSGCGNVADLPTLVAMKVSGVISGMEIHRLGFTSGVRTREKIEQDIDDVVGLILVCKLGRDLELGNETVQRRYEEIFDNSKP